jgi:hypothetical protein
MVIRFKEVRGAIVAKIIHKAKKNPRPNRSGALPEDHTMKDNDANQKTRLDHSSRRKCRWKEIGKYLKVYRISEKSMLDSKEKGQIFRPAPHA